MIRPFAYGAAGPLFGGASLLEQLQASLARNEVLEQECIEPCLLPTAEQIESVHEQLDELLWRTKCRRFC